MIHTLTHQCIERLFINIYIEKGEYLRTVSRFVEGGIPDGMTYLVEGQRIARLHDGRVTFDRIIDFDHIKIIVTMLIC